jgi:hypothetical protein
MINASDGLLTVKEAGEWASGYIGKNVTPSNIAYLIQYGVYPELLDCFEQAGIELRPEIDHYFAEFNK